MTRFIGLLVTMAFVAASAACSNNDEGNADVEATLDVMSDKIGDARGAAADMAGEAADTATTLVEESTSTLR